VDSNSEKLKNKYMNKYFLLSNLVIIPFFAFCQVGVGTNSVDPSAKFQIESSNKGFLQPRITLTGTNDNSTIASPATGLMVFNTATAGAGATAVLPGVYYYSGTGWQRLSDNQPATFVTGSLSSYSGGQEIIAPMPANSFNLGSISIPPGKWEVVLNIMNNCTQVPTTFGVGCNFYMNYWLQDNNTSTGISYGLPASITNITSDVIVPGGASFMDNMGVNAVILNKGTFYINNSTAGNKTYYLFAIESTPCGDPMMNDQSPFYIGLGSSNYKQNRFYATKIN
jgi:hypothetical protein